MAFDKQTLDNSSTWLESDRLHRKGMLVGSAKLFNALVKEHPKIVLALRAKYRITENCDVA